MAEATDANGGDAPSKGGKGLKGLLFAVVGAAVAAGGGFAATYLGAIDGLLGGGTKKEQVELGSTRYLELDPLFVSLGPDATASMLRFSGHLEVDEGFVEEIEAQMPRILDVLNTYLRAVEEAELEDPRSLTRVRAQMLRRLQVVLGEDRVKDLLIIEFVLT